MDIGHANAMRKPDGPEVCDWVRVMAGLIGHFHLHNNDGTADSHDDLDKGTMDPRRVLDAIGEYCEPDVTFTIESRESVPSASFLKKYLENGKKSKTL